MYSGGPERWSVLSLNAVVPEAAMTKFRAPVM